MKYTKKSVLVPYDKYQRLLHEDNPPDSAKEEQEVISEDSLKSRIAADDILSPFSKTLRSKAESLLNFIDRNENLDWDSLGRLVVNGIVIPSSNITDLIKDALVTHKNFEPVGLREFYKHFKNIPLTLIRNPQRRALLDPGGTDTESANSDALTPPTALIYKPPPGIPSKRKGTPLRDDKKKKKTWESTWTTLA